MVERDQIDAHTSWNEDQAIFQYVPKNVTELVRYASEHGTYCYFNYYFFRAEAVSSLVYLNCFQEYASTETAKFHAMPVIVTGKSLLLVLY